MVPCLFQYPQHSGNSDRKCSYLSPVSRIWQNDLRFLEVPFLSFSQWFSELIPMVLALLPIDRWDQYQWDQYEYSMGSIPMLPMVLELIPMVGEIFSVLRNFLHLFSILHFFTPTPSGVAKNWEKVAVRTSPRPCRSSQP